jgi:hypothetical protein
MVMEDIRSCLYIYQVTFHEVYNQIRSGSGSASHQNIYNGFAVLKSISQLLMRKIGTCAHDYCKIDETNILWLSGRYSI